MSQQNEGGLKSFTATSAITAFHRVALTSGSGTAVEHAGATENFIGVAQEAAAAGDQVTVRLRGQGGTFKAVAAGTVVVGATIYGAADGEVDDTASGAPIGTALEAASGADQIIEVVFNELAKSSIGDAMGIVDRYSLVEMFVKAPTLNGDMAPTAGGDHPTAGELALLCRANKDFELLGTNAASANSVPNAGGGILLTTAGADGDGMIVLPHLDTSQSGWAVTSWLTQKELEFECRIETGSAAQIGNCIIWAGLKLTNTDVIATDNDQAFFRYENGVNSGKFQCTASATGTDDTDDSGVTVAAATAYRLRISVGADLVPKFYINDVLVATCAALTTAVGLIPYIAVEADGAAEAKILYVRYLALSRKY
jgi:hypothetical protein